MSKAALNVQAAYWRWVEACGAHGTIPIDTRERLSEVAEILSLALQRALARKSSPICADCGESSLHILPGQSVHPTLMDRRTPDA
jgi:hypothetical protein